MKKLSLLLFSLLLISSCAGNHPKSYLTLSGKLENNKDSIISIASKQGVVKKITIKADGSFKDTLTVEKGAIYTFQTSNN